MANNPLSQIQTSFTEDLPKYNAPIIPTHSDQLSPKEKEDLKDSKSSRWLRIIYAGIAILFAIASVIYWMRFVHFYYDPQKHSDTFFATLTTACTVNILVAFHAVIKGLFSQKE